ncbi:MAG: NfeD family protein [Oscillospiraceae bacterium]|nr:NfeD family protein [Oscillospiraceae bacterium]
MFSLSGNVLFWLAALIVFIVIEAVTVGLASIWFAIGALAALVCAMLHGPIWLQALWFVAVSALTLYFTRPLVKKYVTARSVATNADRNVGRVALVQEAIDNLAATGTVQLDGVIWTARSVADDPIPAGTRVVVREIRGVKLLVEPAPEE